MLYRFILLYSILTTLSIAILANVQDEKREDKFIKNYQNYALPASAKFLNCIVFYFASAFLRIVV